MGQPVQMPPHQAQNISHQMSQSLSLAQFALLDDLHRFGVTASMDEQAGGIIQAFSAPKSTAPPQQALQQHLPEAAQEPTPQENTQNVRQNVRQTVNSAAPQPAATSSPKVASPETATAAAASPKRPFDPQQYILFQQGDLPLTVLITASKGGVAPLSFADAQEQALWSAMMHAIDVIPDNHGAPAYVMVIGNAALEGSLSQSEEALLQQALLEKIGQITATQKAVLAVGGRAHRLLRTPQEESNVGGEVNREVNRGAEKITLKKHGDLPLLKIYQLQAMLRQPALKRQTWETLLQLKKVIR